ncbi:MAG: TldD/PmbA family protein [Clostridia bacterium]|nr:TldD/PmbA family protein [Clostridia bacterium]
MKFEELKTTLIAAAKKAGITDYEIYYQRGSSLSAEALKDELNSFTSSADGGICFRCVIDGKQGYASSELLTKEAVEGLVEKARANAKVSQSEDEIILFAGSDSYAPLEAVRAQFPEAAELRRSTLELQKALYENSPLVGDGTQSGISYYEDEVYLFNSKGLDLSNRVCGGLRYADAVVRQGEEAESAFAFAEEQNKEDCFALPEKTVKTALSRLGAVTIPSGKYPVVIDGKVFKDFLSAFSPIFSAKNAQKGLSRLAGKEGEAIAASLVTIVDDPMREGSFAKTNFDGEGVATAKREVVKDGVLKTLLYDLSTAKKAGVESTGNGQKPSYSAPVSISPYQFSILPGEDPRDALFGLAKDGIFVTGCKGFHAGANAVTGDFSMESYGFLIRDGKQAEPIKSFTISGNIFELFKEIAALGDTVYWSMPSGFTAFGSPDLYLPLVSVAGD